MWQFIHTICAMFMEVACFWNQRLRRNWRNRNPQDQLLDRLRNATSFESWEDAALRLDNVLGLDLWRSNPSSKDYDYRLINERVVLIDAARQAGDLYALVNLLRAGLVRNLGHITSPKMFNCAFGGTKYLVEEYVTQFAESIRDIAELPPPGIARGVAGLKDPVWEKKDDKKDVGGVAGGSSGGDDDSSTSANAAREARMKMVTMSTQTKLDFIHDTRLGFGRSALVLQGGAIFGLCHLGVVKALLLRGLLPRIIVGTGTGAMMAALVGVHPEDHLTEVLKGDGIDLSAFTGSGNGHKGSHQEPKQSMWTRWATLLRRVRRFRREGHFLDVKVLERCVRTNVGDLTFEEAFKRSKRMLNITVVPSGQHGIPTVLNYVTAPNVLVWTAAVASNVSSSTLYGHKETKILCKDSNGNIVPWRPANTVDFKHWTHTSYTGRGSPLHRVAQLFNVNHFIVSQARPYMVPFLRSDMQGPSIVGRRNTVTRFASFLVRMVGVEVRHRLRQLDSLHLLSQSTRRFLVDEQVPGASMMLVPEVSLFEFARLMETPTKETLDYWIRRGEQSVWPAVAALRIRCSVEMELDRAYQKVRCHRAGGLRRKVSQAVTPGGGSERLAGDRAEVDEGEGASKGKEKMRAKSIGALGPTVPVKSKAAGPAQTLERVQTAQGVQTVEGAQTVAGGQPVQDAD